MKAIYFFVEPFLLGCIGYILGFILWPSTASNPTEGLCYFGLISPVPFLLFFAVRATGANRSIRLKWFIAYAGLIIVASLVVLTMGIPLSQSDGSLIGGILTYIFLGIVLTQANLPLLSVPISGDPNFSPQRPAQGTHFSTPIPQAPTSTSHSPNEVPVRLVTGTEMHSETLNPLELSIRPGVAPRHLLAAAVGQIDQAMRALASPNMYPVAVRTVKYQTLSADNVAQGVVREFFSLGVECSGAYSRVIAVLRFTDLGSMASVALESKELLSPQKNALPWFFTTLFVHQEDKNTIGSICGFLICVGIGCFISIVTQSPMAFFPGAAIAFFGLGWMGVALNTHRTRESEELRKVARLTLVYAYHEIDTESLASALKYRPSDPVTIPPQEAGSAAPPAHQEEPPQSSPPRRRRD